MKKKIDSAVGKLLYGLRLGTVKPVFAGIGSATGLNRFISPFAEGARRLAQYKPYSYAQGKFIPVHFEKQILPGTFEYTLSHLIDNELDIFIFDGRYRNNDTGTSAYGSRILLKIVLFACSHGIVSSRKIARSCKENVMFMALSAATCPISLPLLISSPLWMLKVKTQWNLFCMIHNMPIWPNNEEKRAGNRTFTIIYRLLPRFIFCQETRNVTIHDD
jgi:hypothetical protein